MISSHSNTPATPPTLLSKTVVVIPTLNEEACLPGVIGKLRELSINQIRVVDNGSTDRTAEVARKNGAEVLREPRRGYGQACWTGCQNLPAEVEWILFCNADGSDDLEKIPVMLSAAEKAELILGTRTADDEGSDHLTAPQRFGNKLATTLIRWLWQARYTDLGPLRLISRRAFERLQMQDRGFGWTVEMQVRAAEEKLTVREVPVRNFPRRAGVSKISGNFKGSVQAGTIILATIAKLWFARAASQRMLTFLSAFLLVAGAFAMLPFGDFSIVGHVPKFLVGAGVMCAGYAASWLLRQPSLRWMWIIAMATRFVLLFQYPGNDIWRYLWEGRITLAGFNPYRFAPNAAALEYFRDYFVWPQINHPGATTIYPPLAEICFASLVSFGAGVFVFKLLFALADLAIGALLLKRFGRVSALAYLWNPLAIYSFAGGGHYDSLFILPLVAALFLASDFARWRKVSVNALLMGCSIAVKWASGPLAFWWVWRAWRERGFWFAAWTGILTALPMVTLLLIFFPGTAWHQLGPHEWIEHSWSIPLIPGLLKWLFGFAPQNQFYLVPVLIAAIVVALIQKNGWLAAAWFFFFVLVFSPANHAWYFTWFIAVAVGSRNLTWSARLVGVSAFIYFWVVHVNATQGVWKLSPTLTALLWLPFILPPLLATLRRRT